MREKFTLADMQAYGADDAEGHSSILNAIDRALGVEDERSESRGPEWARMMKQRSWDVDDITAPDIPTAPGVHVWSHDGEPVFVGEAVGTKGLRGRIREHLATGPDLSRSTFRASVAVDLLRIDRETARSRLTVLRPVQISVVNDWIRECELTWLECGSPATAQSLKFRMREEWLPRLNIR
ncbi:hypothetical protein ABIE24_001372 [Mycetocola sp. 2940]